MCVVGARRSIPQQLMTNDRIEMTNPKFQLTNSIMVAAATALRSTAVGAVVLGCFSATVLSAKKAPRYSGAWKNSNSLAGLALRRGWRRSGCSAAARRSLALFSPALWAP